MGNSRNVEFLFYIYNENVEKAVREVAPYGFSNCIKLHNMLTNIHDNEFTYSSSSCSSLSLFSSC